MPFSRAKFAGLALILWGAAGLALGWGTQDAVAAILAGLGVFGIRARLDEPAGPAGSRKRKAAR